MSNESFGRCFARRSVVCFFLVAVLFFSCILRVAVTATTDYSAVLEAQSGYRLTVGNLRGTIYDCNMVPITNNKTKIIAAVSPTPRAVTAISGVLDGEERENTLERLKSGKPILCEVPREIECDGISCVTVYEHNSSETVASHLLGYTDVDSRGASGLEKAYDDILYSENKVSFLYSKDGLGEILKGVKPEIENDTSVTASGVVTTIDINLQQIAEEAADAIESGAVIIADSETNEIKAMVSRPDFDLTDVVDYLDKDNSPLLNRALSAYSVGSVFKPCVAAVGIEFGKGNLNYTCTGSCKIIDRYFKCHKLSGHGAMTLKSGMANSCNTYFYNYAFSIGGNGIYNMASSLNFGKSFSVAKGMYVSAGCLPDVSSLSNIAHLANFSIGQGELLVSPVSMLTLYSSIAYDGTYYLPSVVRGTYQGGTLSPYNRGVRTRAMSENTAKLLRNYLSAVIEEGTGVSAKPKATTGAGKTATAQTGRYENGVEICEGWFCGFFPADKPRYTVIVFSEDIKKQSATCSEIFAQIADRITELKN